MKAEFLRNILFTPKCAACKSLRQPFLGEGVDSAFCENCADQYEKALAVSCGRCFCPLYECHCVPQKMERAGITEYIKIAPYDDEERFRIPRRFVLSLKDENCKRNFSFAAEELKPAVFDAFARMRRRYLQKGETPPEVILTYLPRSRQNLLQTGHDQSAELAKALSQTTGLPLVSLLKRTKETEEQKHLTERERAENQRGAFHASNAKGLCVFLLDDVVTSGASMASAARELGRAGAREVIAISFAYTVKK